MTAQLEKVSSAEDLKVFLAKNYLTQIKNFFGDEKQAMKFLSSMMASVQKTPDLLDCDPTSLVNSFMTMAQLGLMPSGVSGEAYVLPYYDKGVRVAQFQLGYQGLVTLFYRAGGTSLRAEIIREHDDFSYVNGVATHRIDILKSRTQRGKVVGALAAAIVNGHELVKVMNVDDILDMGRKFSKSFNSKHTPWNEESDPELWMLKKTVLKQLGKMLPKNETIAQAIAADNEDSVISDRKISELAESSKLQMGNFAAHGKGKAGAEGPTAAPEGAANGAPVAGNQAA